jgi:serine/threonine protein phosphatase PrpC
MSIIPDYSNTVVQDQIFQKALKHKDIGQARIFDWLAIQLHELNASKDSSSQQSAIATLEGIHTLLLQDPKHDTYVKTNRLWTVCAERIAAIQLEIAKTPAPAYSRWMPFAAGVTTLAAYAFGGPTYAALSALAWGSAWAATRLSSYCRKPKAETPADEHPTPLVKPAIKEAPPPSAVSKPRPEILPSATPPPVIKAPLPVITHHPEILPSATPRAVEPPKPPATALIRFERRYPPVGALDTVILDRGRIIGSVHGQADFFTDAEIIRRHESIQTKMIEGIAVEKTEYGKWVIQQQATRGCTAAVAAMLITDAGGMLSVDELKYRNLGSDKDEIRDIQAAGLTPIVTKIDRDVEQLRLLIQLNGSAIVSVNDPALGGHVVVVDSVTDDSVTLRDPYHGWAITVTKEAFLKRFAGGTVIQVQTAATTTTVSSAPLPATLPPVPPRLPPEERRRLKLEMCKKKGPSFLEHHIRSEEHVRQSLEKKSAYAHTAMETIPDPLAEPFTPFNPAEARFIPETDRGTVGSFSFEVAHVLGRRDKQEDRHIASTARLTLDGKPVNAQVFGILDGHGGSKAAEFVRDHLADELARQFIQIQRGHPEFFQYAIIWNALKMTFVALNEQFQRENPEDTSGTTASIAVVIDGELWVANAGDSRTMLNAAGTPIQMTEDMKPAGEHYRQRVLNRGGYVFGGRIMGNLGTGGAIGDRDMGGTVSARPAITRIRLADLPKNTDLIIVCDGVTDAQSTPEIVAGCQKYGRGAGAPAAIVRSALERYSTDNCSCLIVRLT